ncbi:MAG TPA: M23 family metallopeptidase [Xanthomonadales bacterium]|nr:M23 family metallopeptidase [Xanthomonadales bacterium]
MKRTLSQAVIASRNISRRSALTLFGLSVALVLAFLAGRGSVSIPAEYESSLAALRLEIQLQQRDVDRVLQDNRSNINGLSAHLAELQAASTRVDALGERLAQMGQLTLDEFDFNQAAPVGGPADPSSLASASEGELRASIGFLSEKLRRQASQLDALQFLMVNRQMESDLTPTGWPVKKGWISSRYGERSDPFTGQPASHQGLDFVGVRGSEVLSVASGVVVWAGNRTGYGKTVEIDHGNGFLTRYAHNENLIVEPGNQVSAGQQIATLGSSGRASAPHVHFEVLQNGSQVNPAEFVKQLR